MASYNDEEGFADATARYIKDWGVELVSSIREFNLDDLVLMRHTLSEIWPTYLTYKKIIEDIGPNKQLTAFAYEAVARLMLQSFIIGKSGQLPESLKLYHSKLRFAEGGKKGSVKRNMHAEEKWRAHARSMAIDISSKKLLSKTKLVSEIYAEWKGENPPSIESIRLLLVQMVKEGNLPNLKVRKVRSARL